MAVASARASFFRASCAQTWHLLLEFLDDEDALTMPLTHRALHFSSDLAELLVGRRGFHLELVAESLRSPDLALLAIRAGVGRAEDARRLWRSVPPKLKTPRLTEDMVCWWPELVPELIAPENRTRGLAEKVFDVPRDDPFAVDSLKFFPELQDDKAMVLRAVAANGNCIMSASQALRRDPEVALKALAGLCGVVALAFLDEALFKESDFLLQAAEVMGELRYLLARFLRPDHFSLALEAVKLSPVHAMMNLPEELRCDPRLWRTAIDASPLAILHAPWDQLSFQDARSAVQRMPSIIGSLPRWLHDKDLVLCAVRLDGLLLGDHRLRRWISDEDVVLAAVAQNGLALEHVCIRLRKSPVVLRTALAQNGLALAFASRCVRSSRQYVELAVQQNYHALHFSFGQRCLEKMIRTKKSSAPGVPVAPLHQPSR